MIAATSLLQVTDSYFTLIEETPELARYLADPVTAGPWSASQQHGGPPNALAVTSAERALARSTGRSDLVALRLATDFVGPAPVGEIDVRTRVVRAARTAALVEVTIAGGGRDCLLVRVWFVRSADTSAIAIAPSPPMQAPEHLTGPDADFPYARTIEWHYERGGMSTLGPASVWMRPTLPVLPGEQMCGLARVVLAADSASGVSSELDWTRWSFLNVDLDVHLARPFEGEWVHLDAATQLGTHGSALARSTISDVRGVAGAGMQTLVVAEIPTA